MRYAVDICTGIVIDLKTQVAAQTHQHPTGRIEVRIRDAHGTWRWRQVSRLVAMAVYGPPPTNLHEADHIDRDPSFNAWHNLRWVTRGTNLKNRDHRHVPSGETHHNAKITNAQLGELLSKHWRKGVPVKVLSSEYGLSLQYTYRLVAGKHRRDEVDAWSRQIRNKPLAR